MCLKLPDVSVIYMTLPHDIDEAPEGQLPAKQPPSRQSNKEEMPWLLLLLAIAVLILALVGSRPG